MNRGPKPKRLLQKAAFLTLVLTVLGGSGVVAQQYLQAETNIGPAPPAVVTKVLAAETSVKNFDAGPVSLALPKDWEAFKEAGVPDTAYSWRNTAKNKGVQVMTAYVDAMPTAPIAFNRVLVVEAAEDRMQVAGSVSDNCVDFVENGRTPGTGTGKVTARWNGVQFLCDSANFSRDVVGIASTESINGITLHGQSGAHHVFLTFSDASISPKNEIFAAAVDSLHVR